MESRSSLDNNSPPSLDESYWSALFQEEESIEPQPSLTETGDGWRSIASRIDGRFRWSDGGKPSGRDAWQMAREIYEADQTLKLLATGCNKGGLLVQWNGLQGFVPASQLIDFPYFPLESERLQELKQRINQHLVLKIIEIEPKKNRLILSERAALVRANQREHLLRQLHPGDVRQGRVTNLTDFGVFVDLGGVEGLIHISELSWGRVNHPGDIVEPGQEISLLVLDVDRHGGRVALSLKRLQEDPWQSVTERYKPGQLVEGVISNILSFGAFAQLEKGLEGLIHISELAEGTFLHPRNVVKKGDRVLARVLHVDGEGRRLALSLRNVDGADDIS